MRTKKDCSKHKTTERYALIPWIWHRKSFYRGGHNFREFKNGSTGGKKNRREVGANVLESERCSHEQQMEGTGIRKGEIAYLL